MGHRSIFSSINNSRRAWLVLSMPSLFLLGVISSAVGADANCPPQPISVNGVFPKLTGFDKKVLHLAHDAEKSVNFEIEIDFLGNGTWMPYKTITVSSKGYEHYEFPDGFSAHWVRIRAGDACKATAYFMYN